MKKLLALLMFIVLLPATSAWAGMKFIPHKVYVASMVVQDHAVSKADAAVLTDAIKEGVPKFCRQFGNPFLIVVSTEDSAAVIIRPTVTMSEVGKKRTPRYEVTMTISIGEKVKVVRSGFSGYGDFIGGFRENIPHIVLEQIQPAVDELLY